MKKSRQNPNLPASLARYSVAAGAALAASTVPASAGVVLKMGTPFTVGHSNPSHAWDIDGGGQADFSITYHYISTTNFFLRVSNAAAAGNSRAWVKGPTNAEMKTLLAGSFVGASKVFNFATASLNSGRNIAVFTNGGRVRPSLKGGEQYVGFKFLIGSQTDYGWADITLSSSLHTVTFNYWAYDTNGSAIQVGLVPEPAAAPLGLGLLALGAAGVAQYRRRKLAQPVG